MNGSRCDALWSHDQGQEIEGQLLDKEWDGGNNVSGADIGRNGVRFDEEEERTIVSGSGMLKWIGSSGCGG